LKTQQPDGFSPSVRAIVLLDSPVGWIMPTPDNLFERLPPQNIEVELCVLGSMLLDNDAISLVVQQLRPEQFYTAAHRTIYETILEIYEAGAVDMVILRDALKRKNKLETVGGATYLAEIAMSVPDAAHAEQYAQIIREKYTRRELISISTDIIREAYDSSDDASVLVDNVERKIFKVAESGLTGQGATIKETLHDVMKNIDRMQELNERGNRLTGLATGFYDLDDLTSGLQRGELIIIAARPSMGKTTLALNIAMHTAVEEKIGTVIFSLEMGRNQLAMNMLCAHAQIDAHKLRRGRLSEDSFPRISTSYGILGAAPLYIDDTSIATVLQLRAKARRLQRIMKRNDSEIGLIVVDYIQLMSSPVMENRQQQISEISRGLKALAREMNVPVVALSQLNRAVERETRMPRMSDLRESGAIEQDADVVMLLHRPEYYEEKQASGVGQEDESNYNFSDSGSPGSNAKLIIAKQRNGPTGLVSLTFLSNLLRFESAAFGQSVHSGGGDLAQFG